MSRKPAKPAKPVEVVGQRLECAFEPLASALKRANKKVRALDSSTTVSAPASADTQ